MELWKYSCLIILLPAAVQFLLPTTGVAATLFNEVAPLLKKHCVICHQGEQAPLGLRLESLEGLLKGSHNGPVVKPGDPSGSELVRRLTGESLPRMPMTGPPYLSSTEVARIEEWIASGATDDQPARKEVATQPVKTPPSGSFASAYDILLSRCAKCHSDNGIMGSPPEGFKVTSYQGLVTSGERILLVPGQPLASEIVRRIKGLSRPRMPLDGPPYLTLEEIGSIETWVAAGAPDASGRQAPIRTGKLRLEGYLSDDWTLDGLPLNLSPKTRIKKSPRPGDRVEIRATLTPSGEILIERIRKR